MLRLIAAGLAFIVFLPLETSAASYKIMIATWRGCEEACQGFKHSLAEHGIDARFVMRDAGQKVETARGFLADARAEGVDLILTWGTTVTRLIAGTLSEARDPDFDHDIPVVFTVVADPVGAGIVSSLQRTGRRNVTGTYNRVPEEVNVETIRAYLPRFRRLGLIYNSDERNSVLKRAEIAAAARETDFELVALELPTGGDGKPDVDAIATSIARLKDAGVDFLYLGSSSFLRANSNAVIDAAIRHRIPVLSPYEQLVRESKALISVAPRYYDVGRLAGDQAKKILVDGFRPDELSVARMTDFAVVINMRVARRLGLFPPIELLQIAETIE